MGSLGLVTCVGAASTQVIINTFAYHDSVSFSLGDPEVEQDILAAQFMADVATALAECHALTYTLLYIEARVYGGLGGPLTFSPSRIDASGLVGTMGGNPAGPVPSAILSFKLAPIAEYSGIAELMPHNGYIAVSPIAEDAISADGLLVTATYASTFEALRTASLNDLSDPVGSPAVWNPCRVHRDPTGDPIAASRIREATWQTVVSTRRSRLPRL